MLGGLSSASLRRCSAAGRVVHSDHGCQHSSDAFRTALGRHGWRQSMGRIGCRIANAVAEVLFAHCKSEVFTQIPERVEDLLDCLSNCSDDWYSRASTL